MSSSLFLDWPQGRCMQNKKWLWINSNNSNNSTVTGRGMEKIIDFLKNWFSQVEYWILMALGKGKKRLKEINFWRCQRKIIGLCHGGKNNKKEAVAKKKKDFADGNSSLYSSNKTYMENELKIHTRVCVCMFLRYYAVRQYHSTGCCSFCYILVCRHASRWWRNDVLCCVNAVKFLRIFFGQWGSGVKQ